MKADFILFLARNVLGINLVMQNTQTLRIARVVFFFHRFGNRGFGRFRVFDIAAFYECRKVFVLQFTSENITHKTFGMHQQIPLEKGIA